MKPSQKPRESPSRSRATARPVEVASATFCDAIIDFHFFLREDTFAAVHWRFARSYTKGTKAWNLRWVAEVFIRVLHIVL